jgi:hypothetical protein
MTLRSEGAHVLIYVCVLCLTSKAVLVEDEPPSSIPPCPFCEHARTMRVRTETERVVIYECACGTLHATTKDQPPNSGR